MRLSVWDPKNTILEIPRAERSMGALGVADSAARCCAGGVPHV